MLGVGHHGGRTNPSTDHQLVARDELVAEDADGRRGDAPADVTGSAMPEQLRDAFKTGDQSAAPNHHSHTYAGEVFGAFVAVGITLGGYLAGCPKPDEDQGAGRNI